MVSNLLRVVSDSKLEAEKVYFDMLADCIKAATTGVDGQTGYTSATVWICPDLDIRSYVRLRFQYGGCDVVEEGEEHFKISWSAL